MLSDAAGGVTLPVACSARRLLVESAWHPMGLPKLFGFAPQLNCGTMGGRRRLGRKTGEVVRWESVARVCEWMRMSKAVLWRTDQRRAPMPSSVGSWRVRHKRGVEPRRRLPGHGRSGRVRAAVGRGQRGVRGDTAGAQASREKPAWEILAGLTQHGSSPAPRAAIWICSTAHRRDGSHFQKTCI